MKGQADLTGWIKGKPATPLEVELKSADGKISVEQQRWRAFCERWGIPHLVLQAERDEHHDSTVARWLAELDAFVREVQR